MGRKLDDDLRRCGPAACGWATCREGASRGCLRLVAVRAVQRAWTTSHQAHTRKVDSGWPGQSLRAPERIFESPFARKYPNERAPTGDGTRSQIHRYREHPEEVKRVASEYNTLGSMEAVDAALHVQERSRNGMGCLQSLWCESPRRDTHSPPGRSHLTSRCRYRYNSWTPCYPSPWWQ